MGSHKINPARDEIVLRKRVNALFTKLKINSSSARSVGNIRDSGMNRGQLALDLNQVFICEHEFSVTTPSNDIGEFLDLISCTLPEGDLYLFGGVLRDLALFGEKGFSSDIDIVIDGDWDLAYPKLLQLGARKNKFGGLRFLFNGVPIDIWLARETWAIKNGYVEYKNIASLLDTTVLNWDAILMNWRTKVFFHKGDYFDHLKKGYMDIVLEFNPNPLGMLVRVLRHIILKDAKYISYQVYKYLSSSVERYGYEEIVSSETASYGTSFIHKHIYSVFKSKEFTMEECLPDEGICLKGVKDLARPFTY
jgi:hypothetical protein